MLINLKICSYWQCEN